MPRAARALLFVVFTVTGFSALTLQVLWQRVIALHAGVDLVSFTTVIAAFLAGLGFGSLLGGVIADRLGPRRSAICFAAANAVIGVFSFVSIWLFYDLYQSVAPELTSPASKFAFNAGLVLVPTTLMGLSLPLVAKTIVGQISHAGALIGRLYAFNTIGAALGAATSGWVLLGTLGFETTARVAGSLNILSAAIVLVIVSRLQVGTTEPADARAPAGTDTPDTADRERVWPWFVIYGLTGAVALGYELVFFRIVDSVMRANSYSFAHVLAWYLLLFGLGAAIGSAIVRRRADPDRWFLGLQFLVGLSALAGLVVLVRVVPHTPFGDAAARYFTGDGFTAGFRLDDGSVNTALGPVFFLVPLLIMGLPVVCMGASFPCAQALVSQRMETLGRHTGLLLFTNVLGNVVGTLLVGFVLLDRLGTSATYRILALALVVPGGVLVWRVVGRRRRVLFAAAMATTFLAVLVVFPSNQRTWASINGVPVDRLALAEDRSCATALKRPEDVEVLTVNGASQNDYPFDDFHVLIGMMPSLLHPEPARAMALGLGIGATPYGLSVDPRLEEVSTVELCGGEVDLLEGLAAGGAPELQRFFADPRQNVIVGDGRDHLLRIDSRYDVIVVDTLRPQAAFSGSLYSLEFYELLRDRLADGGIIAQWSPTPRVTNTITEVFPHAVRIVVPSYRNSAFIVASTAPIELDRQALLERFAADRPAFQPDQAQRLADFLATVEPQCLLDGGPRPPVPTDGLNHDLWPRDEYFLNQTTNVPERPPSCG